MTLVFDFDSTLCVDESLVTVLEYSLKSNDIKWKEKVKQIEQITQLGVTGKISMPESYKQRLAIAKPTIASITKYLHDAKQNDKITPGMRQLIADFRKQFPNVGIHVLSQGPKCVIDPIAQTVGIPSENCHAVILDVENGEKTGKYIADDEPMLHLGKSKILKKLLAEKKIKEPIIMVGDGTSDMQTKVDGVAKYAIGFGAIVERKETKQMADYFVTDVESLQKILIKLFSS